ncbi:hypothetical protein BJ875DRAFT_455929 [Amylocarpus encephaloides]|uniref:Calmodulin n=1 Tax=Amylocarpus encephaloides TaxID=45428 RepID=A0A9P8C7T1_9HELO|nr:hypothetical protein BJ875DRAFT_455929 [Amylocarpus encephaloides]
MILTDQFPRNIYRHTIHMYDGDNRARTLVDKHDWMQTLAPEECLFIPCLIMTHQENVEDQRYCLAYYEKLEPHLSSELQVFRTIFQEHLEVVTKCGCFPHRDRYYGRQTTDIGRELMANPKLRYDRPLMVKSGQVKFGIEPVKLWKITQLAFDLMERIDALAKGAATLPDISVVKSLSPGELVECREIFSMFDIDGNGTFGAEEFKAILSRTGRPDNPARVKKAMAAVSRVEEATSLTFEQFACLLRVEVKTDWEYRMLRRFEFFDTDGTGEIDMMELKECIQGLDTLATEAEVEDMMKECDKDGNGTLSYEEWKAMVPVLVERRPSQAIASPTVFKKEIKWPSPTQYNLTKAHWR